MSHFDEERHLFDSPLLTKSDIRYIQSKPRYYFRELTRLYNNPEYFFEDKLTGTLEFKAALSSSKSGFTEGIDVNKIEGLGKVLYYSDNLKEIPSNPASLLKYQLLDYLPESINYLDDTIVDEAFRTNGSRFIEYVSDNCKADLNSIICGDVQRVLLYGERLMMFANKALDEFSTLKCVKRFYHTINYIEDEIPRRVVIGFLKQISVYNKSCYKIEDGEFGGHELIINDREPISLDFIYKVPKDGEILERLLKIGVPSEYLEGFTWTKDNIHLKPSDVEFTADDGAYFESVAIGNMEFSQLPDRLKNYDGYRKVKALNKDIALDMFEDEGHKLNEVVI